jgi:hypothetical protein
MRAKIQIGARHMEKRTKSKRLREWLSRKIQRLSGKGLTPVLRKPLPHNKT